MQITGQITGQLIEVGNLEGATGRGIRMDVEGECIEVTGLTEAQCSDAALHYGATVTLTIAVA